MRNWQALIEVRDILNWLTSALDRSESEDVIFARLRGVVLEWELRPEFAAMASILAKAWLDSRPESSPARALLEEHLGGMGLVEELAEIESGAPPRPLSDISSNLDEVRERLFRTADATSSPGRSGR